MAAPAPVPDGDRKAVDAVLCAATALAALGLLPPAMNEAATLKAAFRRVALTVHPDKNADPRAAKAFQLLAEHYAAAVEAFGGAGCVAAPRRSQQQPSPTPERELPLPCCCGEYRLALAANSGGYRYLCIVHPSGLHLAMTAESVGAFQQRRREGGGGKAAVAGAALTAGSVGGGEARAWQSNGQRVATPIVYMVSVGRCNGLLADASVSTEMEPGICYSHGFVRVTAGSGVAGSDEVGAITVRNSRLLRGAFQLRCLVDGGVVFCDTEGGQTLL
jgi:hypothetical protein